MNGGTQTDEDVALAFAVTACLLGVSLWLGYLWPSIVLGILLALGVMALIPARR